MSNLTGFGSAEDILPDPVVTKAEITRAIADELRQVEELFLGNLTSPLSIVDEIGEFVAEGGGKRIRPTLHLLTAKLCAYDGPHDVLLATVLEFIHSATLIHDDIIDEATTRRGHVSVNHRWGNEVTVLFGDYLFAKAMEMALQAGSLQIMRRLADVTLRMTEGEMLQTRYVGRLDLTVDEHLELVRRKTAELFACCCDLAGTLAGASREKQDRLGSYGKSLGMAFQLVDDLLDFTGNSRTLGKPAASDLREGKATLAVIYLLEAGSSHADEAEVLGRRIMDGEAGDSQEIANLTDLLHESGAIARAREMAATYARRAVDSLDGFPESPARRALASLPDLVLFRDR